MLVQVVAEQGDKQSEANDLGVAVALILLSACPAVLLSIRRVEGSFADLSLFFSFSGSISSHVLGPRRAADSK